jgi:hypothetical protein
MARVLTWVETGEPMERTYDPEAVSRYIQAHFKPYGDLKVTRETVGRYYVLHGCEFRLYIFLGDVDDKDLPEKESIREIVDLRTLLSDPNFFIGYYPGGKDYATSYRDVVDLGCEIGTEDYDGSYAHEDYEVTLYPELTGDTE